MKGGKHQEQGLTTATEEFNTLQGERGRERKGGDMRRGGGGGGGEEGRRGRGKEKEMKGGKEGNLHVRR